MCVHIQNSVGFFLREVVKDEKMKDEEKIAEDKSMLRWCWFQCIFSSKGMNCPIHISLVKKKQRLLKSQGYIRSFLYSKASIKITLYFSEICNAINLE